VIYLGVFPGAVVGMMTTSVNHFVELIKIGGQFAGM
jgi:hypothetical protein